MRVHTECDGKLFVNSISAVDGKDVEGHLYYIQTGASSSQIQFQQGTVPVEGVNGVTNEALLAILIHRIKFLNSKVPCLENSEALFRLEKAMIWFNQRTANRKARGVEGKDVI